MKQAHLLAGTPESTSIPSWLPGDTHHRGRPSTTDRKLVERIGRLRQLVSAGAAVLAIALVFLGTSYLFFVQLAQYGW